MARHHFRQLTAKFDLTSLRAREFGSKPAFEPEEQIIAILKEQEAGMATADVCRRHGIRSATFYKWKSKYGGLEVSEVRCLRTLEEENARLKKLLAEAMLDNVVLTRRAAQPTIWRQKNGDARR